MLRLGGVPEAEIRLAAFLEGSLETNRRDVDSLMNCIPDDESSRYVTLARYRILGSHLRDDTVHATAEVVTVAEQIGDSNTPKQFVTTVRTKVDTLHFALTRMYPGAEWGVCGFSVEGLEFGHTGSDQEAHWTRGTYSWSRVKQIAESVHAAP